MCGFHAKCDYWANVRFLPDICHNAALIQVRPRSDRYSCGETLKCWLLASFAYTITHSVFSCGHPTNIELCLYSFSYFYITFLCLYNYSARSGFSEKSSVNFTANIVHAQAFSSRPSLKEACEGGYANAYIYRSCMPYIGTPFPLISIEV